MHLSKENEKKAYDAMQKIQAVDAAGEWDKLTEEDLFWSLIHCVYEHMNSDQILKRPTVKVPWCPAEWKAEVCAKSKKAFDMFLGYMPPDVRLRFSQSKIVSADQVADYLRETWESRDYYEEWIGRWKWEWWGVGHPMPTYEERVEYVNAMMELLEKRKKKKEQRMLAKKKAEEVREMKAKVKGKGKGKAKGKGKSPEPTRSNISSALPGPPPPPSAMSRPLQVAVASELPLDVSPSPPDPATGPTVGLTAEKMLSELQL